MGTSCHELDLNDFHISKSEPVSYSYTSLLYNIQLIRQVINLGNLYLGSGYYSEMAEG